jgi:hypothetical protein
MTISNEYTPTPAEMKLLKVFLNPENVGVSITGKCEKAGISRNTYYEAMKKKDFVELLNHSTMEMLRGEMNDIIKVFAKKAKEGSYNHGKLLLEMGKMYTQHQVVDTNINADINIEDIIEALEDEEDES